MSDVAKKCEICGKKEAKTRVLWKMENSIPVYREVCFVCLGQRGA